MTDQFSQSFEDGAEDERALILGVMDTRLELDTVAQISALSPGCFMSRTAQIIWASFQEISKTGKLIDSFGMARAMGLLGATGADIEAMRDLFDLSKTHLGPLDLASRVERVANGFKRRMISRAMDSLSKRAMTDVLSEVEAELTTIAGEVAEAGNPKMRMATDYASQFEAYLIGQPILPLESRENLTTTGIPGLDKSLVANPGRLIVIGGLPSAGKTALAIKIAVETAKRGKRVAISSLEMDEDEIAARIVACACGVNSLVALRVGSELVDKDSRYHLGVIRRNLVGIHGCAGDTWTSIEASILREHRRAPLSVAIVDYLQLVGAPDTKRKGYDNEAQMIGEITKSAKRLAQKLKINVIILSQFNRKIEEFEEPTLQHFLGSGQIERDADIALLLWNTDKDPAPSAIRPVACRIAKNRGGARFGKYMLDFDPALNQFTQNDSIRETKPYTPAPYPSKKKGAEAPSCWVKS